MEQIDIKWLQEYAEQENKYKWGKQIKLLITAYEKEKEKNKKLDKENQGLFELYNFNDSSLLAKILKDYKGIIEKQQKEIEELKFKYQARKDRMQKEIEELKKPKYIIDFKTNKITTLTNDFISKDKIKAKVIEIKDRPVKDEFITATQSKLNTIIDIESLLEKE